MFEKILLNQLLTLGRSQLMPTDGPDQLNLFP